MCTHVEAPLRHTLPAFFRAEPWAQPAAGGWLSPGLINDPTETCPATLELHVSTTVHMDRALF